MGLIGAAMDNKIIVTEICGRCGREIKIDAINGGVCNHCRNFVIPCCMCNLDEVEWNCTHCLFEENPQRWEEYVKKCNQEYLRGD